MRNLLCGAELCKPVKGCLHAVCGVVGTVALGADIFDADHFENAANGTARDNAGTGFCGEHANMTLGELAFNSVRNGGSDDGNVDEVTLCVLNALANRFGNFGSFAHADTDATLFIADNDERGEAENFTALNNLCYTVDGDELFF